MSSLAILGAGGHGRVVADAAECAGEWRDIVFFDKAWPQQNQNGPWPIIGDETAFFKRANQFDQVLIAIGDNSIRLERLRQVPATATLATLVHPYATISRHADLGEGSVVFAGAVVNVGARVGRGSIINTGATVDHDCVLDDGVHISPGANLGGGVQVGRTTWVGIGASVKQYVHIGANVIVGAGAAVVDSFPDDVTVVGVPAQILIRSHHAE